ncbi:hypothetical protein Ccrd_019714 [Cynara cardunculus var. scolymus]|uniref:Uncharacterized protein n=1 Tax=Cynara cardunculus var. scolymus TaxID=59895 RepID=A0A103Y3R9_CYNCS|nr:hypothetical protein Ccrd_019714 [Cynara cardunculus var. scolymus]
MDNSSLFPSVPVLPSSSVIILSSIKSLSRKAPSSPTALKLSLSATSPRLPTSLLGGSSVAISPRRFFSPPASNHIPGREIGSFIF